MALVTRSSAPAFMPGCADPLEIDLGERPVIAARRRPTRCRPDHLRPLNDLIVIRDLKRRQQSLPLADAPEEASGCPPSFPSHTTAYFPAPRPLAARRCSRKWCPPSRA